MGEYSKITEHYLNSKIKESLNKLKEKHNLNHMQFNLMKSSLIELLTEQN